MTQLVQGHPKPNASKMEAGRMGILTKSGPGPRTCLARPGCLTLTLEIAPADLSWPP
jgi:hypothetical protein